VYYLAGGVPVALGFLAAEGWNTLPAIGGPRRMKRDKMVAVPHEPEGYITFYVEDQVPVSER
jgi:hypothetical protein